MDTRVRKSLRTRINQLADAFEDAWLAGTRPSISDFLPAELAEQDRVELFEILLELELHYCETNSAELSLDSLLERHQEYAELISTIKCRLNKPSVAVRRSPSEEAQLETYIARSNTVADDRSPSNTLTDPVLEEGKDFGRYRIIKALGQGAMGAVYLAEDSVLNRKVALKIPRFPEHDTQMVERFCREAKSAAAIQHPNVCQVFDIGIHEGHRFISMAYVPGMSLAEHLQSSGPLGERDVVRIIRKIAQGLEAAHQLGIVHRDLKPANIMLTEKGEPIVMDFGLARQESLPQADQLTQSGMIIGSPAYMSPEQIRNSGSAGPKSDIYSLGIMLYQMLAGRLPFRGEILSVIQQIAVTVPSPPSTIRPGISQDLEAVCLKAIEKEADNRFATMAEFAAALAKLSSAPSLSRKSEPAQGQNAPQPTALPISGTRKPGWKVITAAGFTAALICLTVVLFIRTKNGVLRIEIDDPAISVTVNTSGITVTDANDATSIEVSTGVDQNLTIKRGDFSFETDSFKLSNGEIARIRIDLVDDQVIAMRDGKSWQVFDAKIPNESKSQDPPASDDSGLVPANQNAAALTEKQAEGIDRLLSRGVNLNLTQGEMIKPPVRHTQPGLWAVDASGVAGLTDEDLSLLLQVAPHCYRIVLNTDHLTPAGWDELAARYPTELMLGGRSLAPEGWKRLKGMTRLTGIGLRYSFLQDSELEALGELVNLHYLSLMFNAIEGSCFESFGNLTRLNNLDLMGTKVQDKHLRHLRQLESLVNLGLGQTPIDGSGLADLAGLPYLSSLHLNETNISNASLESLNALPALTSLNLLDCAQITDLSSISGLRLTTAHLKGTRVSNFDPLKQMPLVGLSLDYRPDRDREILLAIPTLEFINDQSAKALLENK